jgi:hypothetical protein
MTAFRVPLFLRGDLVEHDWVEFGGRSGGGSFLAPDPRKYVERLPLRSPADMADLHALPFEEIFDALDALGKALAFDTNPYVKQAYEAGLVAANYPASMLKPSYVALPLVFEREYVREVAESTVGTAYLDGWVSRRLRDGRELRVRAFGARTLHVPAGNGGIISANTIIRNAITRSDAIIKIPSNDPLTAMAIALDPKRSATIIGPEAFDSEETMREVAVRAACDIGTANQEGCACARVVYVLSGTAPKGLANANRLGQFIYEAMLRLPSAISTKPKVVNRELLEHVEASRLSGDWYRVIGGKDGEGAIIVSQFDEAVDYCAMLSGRVANLVPVDDIEKATDAVNAYTQTIGIYPESLKRKLRDRLPLFGAQRLTSLGYACNVTAAKPQDAMEPIRRMCKWIVDEECDPDRVFPMWKIPEELPA